ncbi:MULTISPECIES: hypothetical protein [Bacillus subtilis group]|uniref:hypothetical protein n=1 Tax=Bacillus subtilis group TaxID=653685 RepID=UPI001BD0ABF3|nr:MULTISPECIES: hypothetical protein [Bacillus subtilis group]MCB7160041.1 hypothetical protein [Bacillus subtilis]MCB7458961.1 hypothetical protein [Bacillus subtilis]QVN25824.1 hypothetical protein JYG31_11355 [Bacillus halotolerans]
MDYYVETLFNSISFFDYSRNLLKDVEHEISIEEENYILNVGQEQYIEHLFDKFRLEPLKILEEDISQEVIEESVSNQDTLSPLSLPGVFGATKQEVVLFYIPVYGDIELLKIQPSTYTFSPPRAAIKQNELIYKVILFNRSGEYALQQLNIFKTDVNQMMNNLNKDIIEYNEKVANKIRNVFLARKNKILERHNLAASLNIPFKKRESVPQTFAISTPKIKRKITIKPQVGLQPFEPDPTLDESTYYDILKIINDMGKAFERNPSVYSNKGEEDLRDHFLMQLEPNYEGSATGETFNKKGKTDILLRHDGNNAFVGECKFWKGEKSFLSTIDQLLGYLTWRDSKTAVIMFVKNKDFTQTLNVAKSAIKNHKNYVRFNGEKDETWLNYTFNLPGDPNKEIQLALMMYHTVDVD